jgi:molecular chaperone DnaJ
MNKNYYEILGVERDADGPTIKKVYRELSKQHHPDHGGDEEKFKEISEAYSVLSNPEKRAEYDNPNPFGGFGHPFGDIFGQRFRQPPRANPNAPRRGRNIVLERAIPIKYCVFGGKLDLSVSFDDPCPDCAGSGAEEKETCSNCGGSGQVVERRQGRGVFIQSSNACGKCQGRGFTAKKPCESCKGSARRKVDRHVKIDIPRGITDGQVVGVTGAGGSGINGGPPGDLAVRLSVQWPNPDDLTEEQRAVLEEI